VNTIFHLQMAPTIYEICEDEGDSKDENVREKREALAKGEDA
jgi:hypothetical protein